jgi:hypothetical protein
MSGCAQLELAKGFDKSFAPGVPAGQRAQARDGEA